MITMSIIWYCTLSLVFLLGYIVGRRRIQRDVARYFETYNRGE